MPIKANALKLTLSQEDQEAFWSYVTKSPTCWEWIGKRNNGGYGSAYVRQLGRHIGAHRVSYVLAHGEIEAGLLVCYTCDNRPCVCPDHLFAGTHMENMHDAYNKGRTNNPHKDHSTRIITSDLKTIPTPKNLPTRRVVGRVFLGSQDVTPNAIIERYDLQGPWGWDALSCGHWVANRNFDNSSVQHGCADCAVGDLVLDKAA